MNEILHGPKSQQEALEKLWADGVRKPTQQAEDPYVQMVLSASPSFFRSEGQGPGEWDPEKLKAWQDKTLAWLKKEYGKDLVHVSLHLDEDTPHMHVLIVPTYERKSRKPSRRAKQGETEDDFAVRLAKWEKVGASTRTAGRSSSDYWSKMWCRRDARLSYHEDMKALGLGYGRDFVGENEPSPEHKVTGRWVREEAARLADERQALGQDHAAIDADRAKLAEDRAALDVDRTAVATDRAALDAYKTQLADDRTALDAERTSIIDDARRVAKGIEQDAQRTATESREELLAVVDDLAAKRHQLDQDKAALAAKVGIFSQALAVLRRAVDVIGGKLGLRLPDGLTEALDQIEKRAEALSAPEDPREDSDRRGPGF